MRKITFIDLFAGCGGLSEGFLKTGKYEALAHVEWEIPMVNTLRNRLVSQWNHSPEEALKRVVHFDIQKTEQLINGAWDEDTIRVYGESNHKLVMNDGLRGIVGKKKVDLIIGGPPCQAYSIAGRAQDKDSMKFDYRNYLFESFVKVVEEIKPEMFVFENVPGLLSACPGNIPVPKRIHDAFKNINYEIREPEDLKKAVYNSADFGVPQKRNRVIIVGVRSGSKCSLENIYKEIDGIIENTENKTVKDAIGHLPHILPLKKPVKVNGKNISHAVKGDRQVLYHVPRFHNTRDIGIFKEWVSKDMNRRSSEEKIEFYNTLMGKQSNHAKYRSLEWDKPSPTVVAHLYKDGLMFIHPDVRQARSITVKEAALLQSFPDDFDFTGSTAHCFKMIGNAVPPLMAEGIATGVANCLQ